MNLCNYKNSLGIPEKGFHKHFLGLAIFDLLGTILICALISKWQKWNFYLVLSVTLILTILIHRLFCVNTTINKLIFGSV
jgi:hypothetical protein